MAEQDISILAPVVNEDTSIDLALGRAHSANAFAIVVRKTNADVLVATGDLEQAATTSASLSSLQGRPINMPAPLAPAPLLAPTGDLAIRAAMRAVEITGFEASEEYLHNLVQSAWYRCDVQKCPDKNSYRQAGTCAYNHALTKHP
jgi:hypothetical protein